MLVPYSWFQILWYFYIYGFLGWCSEVAFAAVAHGKFVNRGFVNGPICSIYGFGVMSVLLVLGPLKSSLWLLFGGSVLFTSAIEYLTGWVLEKVFHDKWWDYSKRPLNIKGYVCLEFSVLWGLACVFVVDVFQPLVAKVVDLIPKKLGWVLLGTHSAHCGSRTTSSPPWRSASCPRSCAPCRPLRIRSRPSPTRSARRSIFAPQTRRTAAWRFTPV